MRHAWERVQNGLLRQPWLTAGLALAASWFIINPWGDYALNDDWTYAHLAKHIASTNVVRIDVPIAPKGVGQALLGAALTKLLGFHHYWLRGLTLVVSIVGLWAVDALIALATESRRLRLAAVLLLAFNPLYYYSTASFMNELYGWVPPLLGAVLWLRNRQQCEQHQRDVALSPWVPSVAGLIIGLGFYTRQFGVLIFPALLGATLLSLAMQRRWLVLRSAAGGLVLGTVVWALSAWSYFPWAKASGNFRPEFAVRIGNLTTFNFNTWVMQAGSALMYATAFFVPLLVLFAWKGAKKWLLLAGGLMGLALMARFRFQTQAPSDFWVGPIWSHKVFPWVVNIIWNAGLGPITLDDGFFYDAPKPSWPKGVWSTIELLLVAGTALWAAVGARWFSKPAHKFDWKDETAIFGWLLTLGSVVAIVQTHQNEMVDRYYLPQVLGLAVALPALLGRQVLELPSPSALRMGVSLALGLVLATFSVFGAHDQFQWNDARWALIDAALERGGTRATVQGGYEVNCWNRHEGFTPSELRCEGGCRCVYNGFCCIDDRWRVGMSVSPGYEAVQRIQPSYWLAPGPEVILSRRR